MHQFKKIKFLIFLLFFLLPCVFTSQVNAANNFGEWNDNKPLTKINNIEVGFSSNNVKTEVFIKSKSFLPKEYFLTKGSNSYKIILKNLDKKFPKKAKKRISIIIIEKNKKVTINEGYLRRVKQNNKNIYLLYFKIPQSKLKNKNQQSTLTTLKIKLPTKIVKFTSVGLSTYPFVLFILIGVFIVLLPKLIKFKKKE